MDTTIGQILVNDALPAKLRDYDRTLTRDEADNLLASVAKGNPDDYKDISWKLMQLGREASFTEGTTLRLSDLRKPFDKGDLMSHVGEQEDKIDADKTMTDDEKEQAKELVYGEVQKFIVDQTYDQSLKSGNPFAMQVKSKARGNPSQLAAMLTSPSLYQDAKDKTIPIFIRRSYAEGLEPHEYWAATYGARKGVISSKFATRQGGYLGKMLSTAMSDLVVTKGDCETPYGIPVKATDDDNIGSVMARAAGGMDAGTVIDKTVLTQLQKKKVNDIVVRSPITCSVAKGVCKQCTGLRDNGKFPEIGHHIGLNAASALAERIAQSSLNVKHSGGQSNSGDEEKVYAGFDVVKNLATVPETFPHKATVAEIEGKVGAIEPAPQGGTNVAIGDQIHYVGPDLPIRVSPGDMVEAGDQLSGGIVNPADAVRLKGIGEGRRYFAERMTQAFRDNSYAVNRRNVEVLARSMVNHVQVDDPGGAGNQLPGDVATYSSVAHNYKPRPDARRQQLKASVGQYLEEPALHHTIGTRLTKKTVDQLKQFGVDSVLTHSQPASFSPHMVSVVKTPEYTNDWMARLGSAYLKTRLLQDVQRGAKSDVHGLHPVPGIAKGTEFGRPPKGKGFTY